MTSVIIRPIGFVRNEMKDDVPRGVYKEVVSEIVVNKDLQEGLDDIEEHSHAVIVFWLDRIPEEERNILKVRPMGNPSLPVVGVFATRSPVRPNPIGIETVEILEREGNILKVKGLDALDGSPVLDIKPYMGRHDVAEQVREPKWMERVHRGK